MKEIDRIDLNPILFHRQFATHQRDLKRNIIKMLA